MPISPRKTAARGDQPSPGIRVIGSDTVVVENNVTGYVEVPPGSQVVDNLVLNYNSPQDPGYIERRSSIP